MADIAQDAGRKTDRRNHFQGDIGMRGEPQRLPFDEAAEVQTGRVGEQGGEGENAQHCAEV